MTGPPGPHRPAAIVATLALGGTVVSLQQTLMLPVLPDFPRLLHTTADNASWVVTATLVAGATAVPTLSRLADMFGKKRMLLIAFAVMMVAGVLGAVGDGLALVLVARTLQGTGLAVVPIGLAIMRDELPRDRLPLGVALVSGTLAIGAGAALPLAGLVVTHLGWPALFWVTGAASAVSFAAVVRFVPESRLRTGGSFDYVGALLLSAAMTAILLALSKAANWGWTSRPTVGLTLLGLLLAAIWVPVELRSPAPLVDLRVTARPAVLLVNLASALAGFAMFVNMVGTTALLQQTSDTGYGLGLAVFDAGLWMVPTALVYGAWSPVSAAMIRRYGARLTLLSGGLLMAATYAGRVALSAQLWQVVVGSMVVGIGTSMTFAALPSLIMAAVPPTETASANGLTMLLRSVGTATASATLAALTTGFVVDGGGVAHPSFAAFTTAFWLGAVASVATAALAVPLRARPDEMVAAEPTPAPTDRAR